MRGAFPPQAGNLGAAIANGLAPGVEAILKTMREVHGQNFARNLDVYKYRLQFSALDNGGTQTQSFSINASSTFIWTGGLASVRNATVGLPFMAYEGAMTGGANVPSWPVYCQITDNGDNEQLQAGEVPLGAWFGDAATQGERQLIRPRLFSSNSSVSVTLRRFAEGQRDAAGAATNFNLDIDLVFTGYRIKIAGRQELTAGIDGLN